VRLLRQLRPDVLQTWLYHADLAGVVAGGIARVPRIVWNIRCAELDPRDHPRSLPALLRVLAFLSARPAAIICNSEAGRRAHERIGYRARRWEIIPNGFDTGAVHPTAGARAQLRRALGIRDDAKVVGLLARFHPMKDHITFLEAAAIVTAAHPDIHFVAAGRGVPDAPPIARWMDGRNVGATVHLLPEQTDGMQFLAALDVAVSSSYSEAFPNVVAEAMACGIPCVATDVGESTHIVGPTGAIVPPRDPVALAAAINRILDLGLDARQALGAAARERIVSEFSIDRAAVRYDDLYAELTGAQIKASVFICAG
jgi:glycosyltransferase involved in cell wall biosynthesis